MPNQVKGQPGGGGGGHDGESHTGGDAHRDGHGGPARGQDRPPLERLLTRYVRPIARKLIYASAAPPKALRGLYATAFDAHFVGRETYEFAWRSLVATPIFLARCAAHGDKIAVDRLPYMTGPCRIELGSNIRISGQINISASSYGRPVLKIGNGVFIGHACSFDVADRIEIGNFVSLGAMTYVADTEGHSNYNVQRPIWEVLASKEDIAPVVIEDGVQIGKRCMILKGVRIGARSIIGAGAVVRSDIPPDSIVLGNPARVVKRMPTPPDAVQATATDGLNVDGAKRHSPQA